MRTKIVLLISAAALMMSVVGFAAPATAAPAEPYDVSRCQMVGVFEHCYTDRGVKQANVTPSGNIKITINGRNSTTVSYAGEVIESYEEMYHLTIIHRHYDQQVGHLVRRGSFSYGGTTCTYEDNIVYANGDVRHHLSNVECS